MLSLTVSACGLNEWQEVELPLPEDLPEIGYLRKPMPNAWVGTEQYRRLRIEGKGLIDLPGQMSGRDPTNVYVWRDSSGVRLVFQELGTTAVVDLERLKTSEEAVPTDSLGTFIGAFVSPEIRDLRFVPAAEAPPVER